MQSRLMALAMFTLFGIGGWVLAAYEHGFAHAIGIDTQGSQEYAFFSGFGAFVMAMLGFSGIAVTVTHHLNCHHSGCWRVGRIHEGGRVYCIKHHHEYKPKRTAAEILESIERHLADLRAQPFAPKEGDDGEA